MKFIHTSDWHLGFSPSSVPSLKTELAEARFRAVKRIRDVANEQKVDFVVVAGDVFDSHGIGIKPVQYLAELLEGFECRIYLLPGNHDQLNTEGIWNLAQPKLPGKAFLMREEKPIEVPGGQIFPCPVRQKKTSLDATAWIASIPSSGIRVGVAHGSLAAGAMGVAANAIAADAWKRVGLHYLALGDTHSFRSYRDENEIVRMSYSGTPEPSSFAEDEAGYVALVSIGSDGIVEQERIKTAEFAWYRESVNLGTRHSIGDVRQIVSKYLGSRNILRLHAKGVVRAEEWNELDKLEATAKAACAHFEMDRKEVRPMPEDDAWIDSLPAGLWRSVGKELVMKTSGANAEVATHALIELYAAASEVSI